VVLESRRRVEREAAQSRRPGATSPVLVPSTFRIGLAGPPGAGKSSLIEALGLELCNRGHRVAVVAVDPSSTRSGGSILGDKTRMQELSTREEAFVRPSPTRGKLGGVAEHTNDVILLCEAAGFDVVLVETVGLGQSEVVVDEAVDMLLLVAPPGGGDELQGIKKGIMEVMDVVVVNKADGDLLGPARHVAADVGRAIQLLRPKHAVWTPRVVLCSAVERTGIVDLWNVCCEFRASMARPAPPAPDDDLDDANSASTASSRPRISWARQRRARQGQSWMWSALDAALSEAARADPAVVDNARKLLAHVAAGTMTPRRAGNDLFRTFLSRDHHSSATRSE
jgi:LAO/AO transport system kinase